MVLPLTGGSIISEWKGSGEEKDSRFPRNNLSEADYG